LWEPAAGVHWNRGLGRYVWLAEGNKVWEGSRAAPLDGCVDAAAKKTVADPGAPRLVD
jgi:hypothetical protein